MQIPLLKKKLIPLLTANQMIITTTTIIPTSRRKVQKSKKWNRTLKFDLIFIVKLILKTTKEGGETPSLTAEQLQKIEKSRVMALERLRASKRRQFLNNLTSNLHESWKSMIEPEFEKEYFTSLLEFLLGEKDSGKVIFPPEECVMEAFRTDFNNLKVIIIGQGTFVTLNSHLKILITVLVRRTVWHSVLRRG